MARNWQFMNELLRRTGRYHDLAILKAQEHFAVRIGDLNTEKPPTRNVTPAAKGEDATVTNEDSPPGQTAWQHLRLILWTSFIKYLVTVRLLGNGKGPLPYLPLRLQQAEPKQSEL